MIAVLKEEGIYENTIIFFTSDNGPTYTGGVDFDFFESSSPFANGYGRTKGFLYEGGIRVPLIVSWPGTIEKQLVSEHTSAFQDMLPTFCALANADLPEDVDGISMLPALLRQEQKVHKHLYWEFPSYNGQQAVLMGSWKGIRKDIFNGNMDIELYNIEEDVQEQYDVSDQFPDIVNQMDSIMKVEHIPAENIKFKIKELGDI